MKHLGALKGKAGLAAALILAQIAMAMNISPVWAGLAGFMGREGHGGRVWACQNENGETSYKLLDYWLAERSAKNAGAGFELDLGHGTTLEEKVQYVIDRIARVEPHRAAYYQDRFNAFFQNSKFTSDEYINLGEVDEILIKPKNCDLKQVIHQPRYEEQYYSDGATTGEQYEYYITEHLWEPLDIETKAGLVIHEIGLGDAVLQGHTRADSFMRLNAFLSSTEMNGMTPPQWLSVLKSYDFGYRHESLILQPNTVEFGEGHRLAKGNVKPLKSTEVNFISTRDGQSISAHGQVLYHQNGQLASAHIKKGRWIWNYQDLTVNMQIAFHSNGAVAAVWHSPQSLETAPAIETSVGKILLCDGTLQFDEEERIRGIHLSLSSLCLSSGRYQDSCRMEGENRLQAMRK